MARKKHRTCVICSREDFVQSHQKEYKCLSCRMKIFNGDPERRKRKSEKMKEIMSNPERKNLASEQMRRSWENEEIRENRIRAINEANKDPEVRERRSRIAKEAHARPDVKERHKAACAEAQNRPETSQKKSESLKKVIGPILRHPEKRIANSLRNGGNGDLERIDKWKSSKLAWKKGPGYLWQRSVKSRDNFACQHCGSSKDLHAHHIKPRAMFPEHEFAIENGITLCKQCHLNEHKRMREESKTNEHTLDNRV